MEHLGDQHGRPGWGWQTRVAETLGMAPPALSATYRGSKAIGRALQSCVAERLGFDPRFFTDESGRPVDEWLTPDASSPLGDAATRALRATLAVESAPMDRAKLVAAIGEASALTFALNRALEQLEQRDGAA
ncbi:MAG: hypothetical protein KC586_09520 [Myxococcales bacterium]|nr:hypothetical protein [Myxococcales bacterium]